MFISTVKFKFWVGIRPISWSVKNENVHPLGSINKLNKQHYWLHINIYYAQVLGLAYLW